MSNTETLSQSDTISDIPSSLQEKLKTETDLDVDFTTPISNPATAKPSEHFANFFCNNDGEKNDLEVENSKALLLIRLRHIYPGDLDEITEERSDEIDVTELDKQDCSVLRQWKQDSFNANFLKSRFYSECIDEEDSSMNRARTRSTANSATTRPSTCAENLNSGGISPITDFDNFDKAALIEKFKGIRLTGSMVERCNSHEKELDKTKDVESPAKIEKNENAYEDAIERFKKKRRPIELTNVDNENKFNEYDILNVKRVKESEDELIRPLIMNNSLTSMHFMVNNQSSTTFKMINDDTSSQTSLGSYLASSQNLIKSQNNLSLAGKRKNTTSIDCASKNLTNTARIQALESETTREECSQYAYSKTFQNGFKSLKEIGIAQTLKRKRVETALSIKNLSPHKNVKKIGVASTQSFFKYSSKTGTNANNKLQEKHDHRKQFEAKLRKSKVEVKAHTLKFAAPQKLTKAICDEEDIASRIRSETSLSRRISSQQINHKLTKFFVTNKTSLKTRMEKQIKKFHLISVGNDSDVSGSRSKANSMSTRSETMVKISKTQLSLGNDFKCDFKQPADYFSNRYSPSKLSSKKQVPLKLGLVNSATLKVQKKAFIKNKNSKNVELIDKNLHVKESKLLSYESMVEYRNWEIMGKKHELSSSTTDMLFLDSRSKPKEYKDSN